MTIKKYALNIKKLAASIKHRIVKSRVASLFKEALPSLNSKKEQSTLTEDDYSQESSSYNDMVFLKELRHSKRFMR
jgi:hypothetical protein